MVRPERRAKAEGEASPQELITRARLAARFRRLDFLGSCSVGERLGLAESCEHTLLEPGATFQTQPTDDALTFLIAGALRLDRDGVSWLDSESPQARSPLPGGAQVVAGERSRGAEVVSLPAASLLGRSESLRGYRASLEALILEKLFSDYDHGTLRLPAMPTVAFRIRERAEDPNANLQEVAEIAQADGAIAGRLLHVANSVAFANGPRLRTVLAAVQRLGLKTTQYLVLSLAIRDVFSFKGFSVRKPATESWRFSVAVSAAAHALAGAAGMNRETALMAGLLHQIGRVPILAMLEREGLRLGEDTLESLFEVLTIPLSRMVHRYWDLDDDCLLAMDHWNNWTRDHPGPGDFGDLVQVAARHCLARQHSKNPAPELGALPAYTRLGFTAEDQAELEREMDTNIGMMGPLLQG